jgi:hypothetical protein
MTSVLVVAGAEGAVAVVLVSPPNVAALWACVDGVVSQDLAFGNLLQPFGLVVFGFGADRAFVGRVFREAAWVSDSCHRVTCVLTI